MRDELGRFVKGFFPGYGFKKGDKGYWLGKKRLDMQGENNPNFGKSLPEETRKKISIALSGKNHPSFGKHLSVKTRKKISRANKGQIPWISGRHHSEETKEKIRNAQKGEKSVQWKGGISRVYKTGYYSKPYREWRKNVFERDDYTCQDCKKRGGELNAHHIKSFAEFPELRFNLDNGLTLCFDCHMGVQ